MNVMPVAITVGMERKFGLIAESVIHKFVLGLNIIIVVMGKDALLIIIHWVGTVRLYLEDKEVDWQFILVIIISVNLIGAVVVVKPLLMMQINM